MTFAQAHKGAAINSTFSSIMTQHHPLIKNTFLYAIGPLLSRGLSIVLIPYYSFLLTTSELGYYDLVVSVGALAVAVITIKIADVVYRWLMDSKEDTERMTSAMTNSLFIIASSVVLVALIFALIPDRYGFQHQYLIEGYIISIILFNFLQQLLRGLGFIKMYAWLSVIHCLLLVVLNVVFLKIMQYKLSGIMWSAILANMVSTMAIVLLIGLWKYVRLAAISIAEIKKMFAYSLPLVLNAVNWWLMGGFDRLVIVAYLGLEFNGIYAVANKVAAVLILLNSFFIPAWQDFILKNTSNSEAQPNFNKFFNAYLILLISLVLFLVTISKVAMVHLIDIKFLMAYQYIPILLLGGAMLAFTSFLGPFFLIAKNTRLLFLTTLAGCVVNIVASLCLVGPLGLYGPSLGLLAGFTVTFAIRYRLLKQQWKLHINWRPIIALGALLILLTWAMSLEVNGVNYGAIALSIAILVWMNKSIGLASWRFFMKQMQTIGQRKK